MDVGCCQAGCEGGVVGRGSAFGPSGSFDKTHAILATAAVVADTDEAAERLAATVDLNFVRRTRGIYGPLESPDAAFVTPFSPREEAARRANRSRVFVGSPGRVRDSLGAFAEGCGADEIMITTAIFDHEARRRSYELLAEAFGLEG